MQPRLAITMSLVLFAACAGGPATQDPQELFDPGRPTEAQLAQLKQAERAYRDRAPGFAAQRDQLAEDPVTAAWLTRLFVRDLVLIRENPSTDRDAVLRAASGQRNPAEQAAIEQVQALGAAAMPVLLEDLLKNRQGMPRELGVELIGAVGAVGLPALQPPLRDGDERLRRTALRAVAAMPASPAVLAVLRQAAQDPEFSVRGAAMRGLAIGDDTDAARLRQALATDADPFVRRMAALALGGHPEPQNAAALIDYLARSKRERDRLGEDAAQEALQQLSGTHKPRTAELWRLWLQDWHPAAAGRPQEN